MDWKAFESLAREQMSKHLGVTLVERQLQGGPKKFDMVSAAGTVVGDAKCLTLVRGQHLPPAKFMEIAGHMWLLERTTARRRFLVFGNQRRVSEWWLEKCGGVVGGVEFYFLADDGTLDQLR